MHEKEQEKKEDTAIETPLEPIQEKGMLSEKFVEAAIKQIELRRKLLLVGLKALRPHDFQNFDGKPYLEGEGAARIMAVVRGFKVGEARFTVEIISPHYFVECAIPMEFMGATTVAIGDCSTQDAFFTGREGDAGRFGKYQAQTGSDILAARLLLGDAKKKARENAISRGVTELLGIRGLSWDELKEMGFAPDAAGSTILFKSGSQGGEIKTITVSEAMKATVGSVVNIKGSLVEVKERQVKGKDGKSKDITDYWLVDENNKIQISKWGTSVEGLHLDDEIFAEKVEISNWQGTIKFLAKEISKMEESKK